MYAEGLALIFILLIIRWKSERYQIIIEWQTQFWSVPPEIKNWTFKIIIIWKNDKLNHWSSSSLMIMEKINKKIMIYSEEKKTEDAMNVFTK